MRGGGYSFAKCLKSAGFKRHVTEVGVAPVRVRRSVKNLKRASRKIGLTPGFKCFQHDGYSKLKKPEMTVGALRNQLKMLQKRHFIHSTILWTSLGDLQAGTLPEATSDRDGTRGPAQVTWRPCPSEDGGPWKMELPRLGSPHHENRGSLKLHTTLKTYRGSAAEMDKTGSNSIRIAAGAIICLG